MVILEAIGIASKEVFDYNRENFKFDQEQRLQKDLSRVEMQIKRFELFRQDIEDLVKLTVDKMDTYHLIGALFLGFTTTIYCEGRVEEPPNWFNGLYLLSVASSFVYLLLAVWLSMHASISSHSFGVRIRTRYVRLPIPSLSQITSLTAKLSDFENQGVRNVMRIPFATSQGQQWQLTQNQSAVRFSSGPGSVAEGGAKSDNLGFGEDGFATEDVVMRAAATLPGKHVHLFRRLQSKWQCYDAYARVSMTLGVHQMLNSLNYFMVGVNMIKWQCPATAFACTLVFQSAALALGLLDIAGWSKLRVVSLQLMGSLPIVIVQVLLVVWGTREKGERLEICDMAHKVASVAYLIQGAWFLLLLAAAKPSNDEASLPRNFRAVLFLDVFGDAAYDPTEAEHALPAAGPASPGAAAQHDLQRHLAAAADHALATARAALRRWEALPPERLSGAQAERLALQRREWAFWRKALQGHLTKRTAEGGGSTAAYDTMAQDAADLRSWAELSEVERQQEEEFAEALLGPLEQAGRGGEVLTYHYDLENGEQVWEELMDQRVLTLDEVTELVSKAKTAVSRVVNPGQDEDGAGSDSDDSSESKPNRSSVATSLLERQAKDRLPWKIVRRMTKLLSLCWFVLGIALIVQYVLLKDNQDECKCAKEGAECERNETGHKEERRLLAVQIQELTWDELELLNVKWPHGSFFQPTTLSCPDAAGLESLIVGSRYALYRGTPEPRPLRFTALPRSKFPPGAVTLCPPPREPGQPQAPAACLLGAPVPGGVAVWPQGGSPRGPGAALLTLRGRPWRALAGSAVRCQDATGLLPPRATPSPGGWCLTLAGWDGERLLITAVSLPGGLEAPPAAGRLAPRLDVPVEPVGAGTGTAAVRGAASGTTTPLLHFEASGGGRLWVLLGGRELHAWDLRKFRSAGRWQLQRAPPSGDFQATALCADRHGRILLVGMKEAVGPALLRTRFRPFFLEGRNSSTGSPVKDTQKS